MTSNIVNDGEKAREDINRNVKSTVSGMQTWFLIGIVVGAIFTAALILTKLPV